MKLRWVCPREAAFSRGEAKGNNRIVKKCQLSVLEISVSAWAGCGFFFFFLLATDNKNGSVR